MCPQGHQETERVVVAPGAPHATHDQHSLQAPLAQQDPKALSLELLHVTFDQTFLCYVVMVQLSPNYEQKKNYSHHRKKA